MSDEPNKEPIEELEPLDADAEELQDDRPVVRGEPSGIPRPEEPEEPEEPEAKEPPVEDEVEPNWGSAAAIADQFVAMPQTCRMGPTRMSTFLLPRDQSQLDKLLAATAPATAPGLIIDKQTENPLPDGSWSVFLIYNRIEYQQIGPKKKS